MTEGSRSAHPAPLAAGSWLAVLGGGQLGRMFCHAAQAMGFRVCVLDPAQDSPAGAVADWHLQADYDDQAALLQIAEKCQACTTEFENVPADSLALLAQHIPVAPGADAVRIAQDRTLEKQFARDAGLTTAPYARVTTVADIDAIDAALFPGILKVARLGYDGKGQASVANHDDVRDAFDRFGQVACVLEQRVDLAAEVSVVVARGFDGQSVTYPPSGNEHKDGILWVSTVPAEIDSITIERAREATIRLADVLDYVGVLCVEYFVDGQGQLMVNEMAPRPHNSGHFSIDACASSQFEQQARAMAGWPLGATTPLCPSVMLNILGDVWFADGTDRAVDPDWSAVVRHPGAQLHLYGKREARRGRKMGHITVLAPQAQAARKVVQTIIDQFG